MAKENEPRVLAATVRSAEPVAGEPPEYHIECRMSDGQKGAFIVVDGDFPELATTVAACLSTQDKVIFVAHQQYDPEDTAIGLGDTVDQALNALRAACPRLLGHEVEVVACALGQGLRSLSESKPILITTL